MTKQYGKRELELSRNLARLFEVLPYEMINAFVLAVYLYKSNYEDEQKLGHKIALEERLSVDNQKRLDVVIPLGIKSYKQIIFELKLEKEKLSQVEDYAKVRNESLIISIAGELENRETKIENIRRLKWEDFFWGLFYLLGEEAQKRLSPDKKIRSQKFDPDFPKRPLGFLAETYLEDFLKDLSQKGYVQLSTGQKVLVVTGEFATKTCKEYNLDFYGTNWTQLFDYLCVVHQGKLQYVGKVKTKYAIIRFEENEIIDENDLKLSIDPKVVMEIHNLDKDKKLDGSSIALLEEVTIEKDPLWSGRGIKIGEKYSKKGPVTQSHRYFETPQKFIEYFKSNE
jgi:hypothetical protein